MVNSIYDQLGAALSQAAKYGQRSILYRGKVLACVVLLGEDSTRLEWGGNQTQATVHILVERSVLAAALGQEGDPQTNETVIYPAVLTKGISPREYIIGALVGQEWDWAMTLTDPTK